MLSSKRVAIIVFAALISATHSSPASHIARSIQNVKSRLVARSSGTYAADDDCDRSIEISPKTWREMDLDNYLKNYPNGNSLSLPMYVEQLHQDIKFKCGLHKSCKVGAICEPVKGKDYYILFATAQWNYYVNSVSGAMAGAGALVKHHVPEIIRDLVDLPPGSDDAHVISEPDLIRIVISPISLGGPLPEVLNSNSTDILAALEPFSTDLTQKLISEASATYAKANDGKTPNVSLSSDESTDPTPYKGTGSFILPLGPMVPDKSQKLPTPEEAQPTAEKKPDPESEKPSVESEDDQVDRSTRTPSVHQSLQEPDIDNAPRNIETEVEEGEESYKADEDEDQKPKHSLQKRSMMTQEMPVLPLVFNSTASVEHNIDNLVVQFQALVDDSFTHKINAPISQTNGIYGALETGRFLVQEIQPATVLPDAKNVINLLTIAGLLRAQNAIIIIRQSKCHVSDNFEVADNRLNFCATDGTLVEVVRVVGDSIKREIHNANLISRKYGFSTAFLSAEAWRCQQLMNGKPDPPKFKKDPFDICTFDIPICDLKEPRLARMVEDGESLVKLCRQEVGLPI